MWSMCLLRKYFLISESMLLVSGCIFLMTHVFCLCYHPFYISFSASIFFSYTAQQAESVNFLYFIDCILTVISCVLFIYTRGRDLQLQGEEASKMAAILETWKFGGRKFQLYMRGRLNRIRRNPFSWTNRGRLLFGQV